MLYVSQLVYDIFKLVLVSITKLFLDVIYKNSDLTQALLQKDFKFGPHSRYQGFGLNLPFILLPPIQGSFFEEHYHKKDLVMALRPRCYKIVLILLNKVIVIYVRLIYIDVWGLRFESLLWEIF